MRVLLVTSDFFKAEGIIAKGIVTALPNCEIFFFSVHEFNYRLDEFMELMKKVDVVHWLFNVAHLHPKYNHLYSIQSVPQMATVHHVCPDEMNKVTSAAKTNLIHIVSEEWNHFVMRECNTPTQLVPLGFTRRKDLKYSVKTAKSKLIIGMSGFYPGKNNRKRVDIAIDVFKGLVGTINFSVALQGKGWGAFYQEFHKHKIPFVHRKFSNRAKALQFYNEIDLYLCTSDYEGGPFPVLEAMANAVPIVSTKVGMAKDLITKGGGILCEKTATECLINAVLQLYHNNSLYQKNSKQAVEIAKNYEWTSLGAAYETMYFVAIEKWEEQHKLRWQTNIEKLPLSKKQRRKEIIHDHLNHSVLLFQQSQFLLGFKMLLLVLGSHQVKYLRKLRVIKKISNIFLQGNRKITNE